MPEGHSIHRLSLAFTELLHGQRLAVTSPQGRFASGAELLDGRRLVATDAHGKHLFLGFSAGGVGSPRVGGLAGSRRGGCVTVAAGREYQHHRQQARQSGASYGARPFTKEFHSVSLQ